MYSYLGNQLLNIAIVGSTVWIVKRFWGSFFEKKAPKCSFIFFMDCLLRISVFLRLS